MELAHAREHQSASDGAFENMPPKLTLAYPCAASARTIWSVGSEIGGP
jgi:hypothetical protein